MVGRNSGKIALLVAGLAIAGIAASPQVLAADKTTHLGVPPSEFVTLLTADTSDFNGDLARIFPDLSFVGGLDDTFAVPSGKILIITDVEVEFLGDPATQVGAAATATLFLTDPTVTSRAPWYGHATLDARAKGYVSAHFTAGIPAGPGIEVNVIASATPAPPLLSAHASVQGYLLDE